MAKTDRKFINRTIKFLIIVGTIVYIDSTIELTSNINKFIQGVVSIIFGLKAENTDIYTSLYAAIAVLLSSKADLDKKLWYFIGLIIGYIVIFIFLIVGRMTYPFYSYPILNLIMTLIVFITMTFPILLWIMLNDEISEDNKDNKKVARHRVHSKPHRTNKSV